MKFTLTHIGILAVVAYVVYNYFNRESMSNAQTITTAIGVVVGVVILGGLAMYATSK